MTISPLRSSGSTLASTAVGARQPRCDGVKVRSGCQSNLR